MGMIPARKAVLWTAIAVSALAAGCDLAADSSPGGAGAFGPSALVWQWPVGTSGPLVLVETPGARTFLFVTAHGGDGSPVIYQTERVGTSWLPPIALVRPPGAMEETIAWAVSGTTPVLATLSRGGAGSVVYTREYIANAWTGPLAATIPGAEQPAGVRLAVGAGVLHMVYASALPGLCATGSPLRHRRRLGPGAWNAAEPLPGACAAGNVSIAAGGGASDPLMVFWTTPALSGTGDDLWGAWSRTGAPVAFMAPQRVPGWQGSARGAQMVSTGSGGYLSTWLQDGSPRFAAWSAFDPAGAVWSVPQRQWFTSSLPPWPVATEGGVLALATLTDAPRSQLVLRHWVSAAQPQGAQSLVATPSGGISSPWLLVSSDGSLQAAWIETLGGVDRVLWAATAGGTGMNPTDAGSLVDTYGDASGDAYDTGATVGMDAGM